MGSERPTSIKAKQALESTDATKSGAASSSIDSQQDQSTQALDSKDSTSIDDSKNLTESETGEGSTKSNDSNELSKNKDNLKAENDLDFSPPGENKTSEKASAKESDKKIEPPLDSSTDKKAAVESPKRMANESAVGVEIVETSQLQIRDESGKVIATSGDAILSVNIERDSTTGDITSIKYPDGKTRNFAYENQEFTGIETLETIKGGKLSQAVLTVESDDKGQRTWFSESAGRKEALSTDIQLNKNGSLSFQLDHAGAWRLEEPNGKTHVEREHLSGARIAFNEDNTVHQITRADNSLIQCKYEDGSLVELTEYDKNGNQVTWTKVNDKWISDGKPPQQRSNFEIDKNGTVSYTDLDGVKTITMGSGVELTMKPGGSKYTFDSDGRFLSIQHNNGLELQGLKYNESGQIKYGRINSNDGKVSHYFRQKDSDTWSVTISDASGQVQELKEWKGDFSVSANGTVLLREDDQGDTAKNSQWIVYKTDGSTHTVNTETSSLASLNGLANQDSIAPIAADQTQSDNLLMRQAEKSIVSSAELATGIDNIALPGKIESDFGSTNANGAPETDTSNMVCTSSGALHGNIDSAQVLFDKLAIDNNDYLPSLEEMQKEEGSDRVNQFGFSERVIEAREKLTEQMESHLDEPQQKRLQIIFDRFERRGKERIEAQVASGQDMDKCTQEWDEKIFESYENLSKMLDPNLPGATYDLRVRAKLVEAAAFSLACPVKANDQGNWGCCWMISGVYAGVIQHPDKMTDMLAQLSNTGQYTDLEGKTWTPPKGLLSITSQGGSWTIENCGGGHRSPVAEIWTSVAAYLSEDGRRTDRGSRGGTGNACNHAMKKITGDTWSVTSERYMVEKRMQQELLEKGAYICVYPGHMYLAALEKHGEEWVVCASLQHGDGGRRINGTVTDLQTWNITGGRRRYNPDIDLPECQDSPTGPIGNNWPGGGDTRDWPFPFPIGPDPWPLHSIAFALRLYDEADKQRQKVKEKEEEELKRKKQNEKLQMEQELLEEEEKQRRQRREKELSDRREEERLFRKKQEERLAKKKSEEKQRIELENNLRIEENYKREKALDQARSIDSADAFVRRSKQSASPQSSVRALSEQIIDQNSLRLTDTKTSPRLFSALSSPLSVTDQPITRSINGFSLRHEPSASGLTNRVEIVSPHSDSSSQNKASLEKGSSPKSD